MREIVKQWKKTGKAGYSKYLKRGCGEITAGSEFSLHSQN